MVPSIAFLAIFRKAGAPELWLRAKHLGDPTQVSRSVRESIGKIPSNPPNHHRWYPLVNKHTLKMTNLQWKLVFQRLSGSVYINLLEGIYIYKPFPAMGNFSGIVLPT
jgi:hypothetical protein